MFRIFLTMVLLCTPIVANAQTVKLWKWTPKAVHHDAIVYVRTARGFAGTGTLIQSNAEGSYGVVLTAAHVIGHERDIHAEWQTGQKAKGRVLYCNEADDVAMFAVNPPNGAVVIPMTAQAPPIGAAVECVGLGSPLSQLRHYAGTVQSIDSNSMVVKTPVTHGDSGGAIIYNGYVVGTITGGFSTIHRSDNWNVYSPMIASNASALKKAAVHCQCEYGNCPSPAQRPDVDISQWLPPADLPAPVQKPDLPSRDQLLEQLIGSGKPALPQQQPVQPQNDQLLGLILQLQGQQLPSQPVIPQPIYERDAFLLALLEYMQSNIGDLQARVRQLEARQTTLSEIDKEAVIREILIRLQNAEPQRKRCILQILFKLGMLRN